MQRAAGRGNAATVASFLRHRSLAIVGGKPRPLRQSRGVESSLACATLFRLNREANDNQQSSRRRNWNDVFNSFWRFNLPKILGVFPRHGLVIMIPKHRGARVSEFEAEAVDVAVNCEPTRGEGVPRYVLDPLAQTCLLADCA